MNTQANVDAYRVLGKAQGAVSGVSRWARRRLPPRGLVAHNLLLTMSSNVLARAVMMLSMPLLARLYEPETIGSWQLIAGVNLIISTIICGRYEVAIVLPQHQRDANAVFLLCLLVALTIAGGVALSVATFPDAVAGLLGGREFESLLWTLPLAAIAMGVHQPCAYLLTRCEAFGAVAKGALIKAVCMVLFPIAAYYISNSGLNNLVIGTLCAHVLSALALLAFVLTLYIPRLHSPISKGDLTYAASRFRAYPLFVAPAAFITLASTRLIYFIIGFYGTREATGLFSLASTVTFIPVTLVSQSLCQVCYPKFVTNLHSRELQYFIARLLLIIATAATPLAALFAYFAEDVFAVTLGERWRSAGAFAAWLTLPSIFTLLTGWLVRLLDVTGKQRLAFGLEFANGLCGVTIVSLVLYLGGSTVAAIAAYAVAATIYNALWLLIVFFVCGFTIASLWAPLVRVVCLAILSWAITWLCHSVLPLEQALLIIVGLHATFVSVYLSKLLRRTRS